MVEEISTWNDNFVFQTLNLLKELPFAAFTALQTSGIQAVNLLK